MRPLDYFPLKSVPLLALSRAALAAASLSWAPLAGSYVDGVADTYEFLEGGRYDFEVVGSGVEHDSTCALELAGGSGLVGRGREAYTTLAVAVEHGHLHVVAGVLQKGVDAVGDRVVLVDEAVHLVEVLACLALDVVLDLVHEILLGLVDLVLNIGEHTVDFVLKVPS